MNYYKTNDPWAAVAMAEYHNNQRTEPFTDGVTLRVVGVREIDGFYFVEMPEPALGVSTITVDEMDAHIPQPEGV